MIIIPVSNTPNQRFSVKVPLGDANKHLGFFIYWNEIAEYWQMTLRDEDEGVELINGLPLVTGQGEAVNLLEQFDYLKVGKAYIIKVSKSSLRDYPGLNDWGRNFVLAWGD
jgi:hypothetical protein